MRKILRSPIVRFAHRQRGQAMVLALVCMIVFVVGVLVLFNTGQAVNKKVQLNNTADAAAYSAAIQQARAYNLIAYLNRAQVGNEIAVAQMVSVHSWLNYTISATDHFADAINDIGIALDFSIIGAEVGVELNEIAQEIQEMKQGLEEGRNVLKGVFTVGITTIGIANQVYSEAARGMALAALGEVPQVARSVVIENTKTVDGNTDREASIDTAGYGILEQQAIAANKKYIRVYNIPVSRGPGSNPAHTADADRLQNVVMKARDLFSSNRDGDFFILHKRGGTDLISYNRWVGLDSMDLKIPLPWPFPDIKTPLAWGGAAGVKSNSGGGFRNLTAENIWRGWTSPYDNRFYPAYGDNDSNDKAGPKARKDPAEPDQNEAILTGYTGLHSYEDTDKGYAVEPSGGNGGTDVGPVFTVFVVQKQTDIRTSSNIPNMGGKGDVTAPDNMPNNRMTALSSAQVYFNRSAKLFGRDDGKREMGNLFSPYWQVRLVDTPDPIRLEVVAADSVGF